MWERSGGNPQRQDRISRLYLRYSNNIQRTPSYTNAYRNALKGNGGFDDADNRKYSRATYMGLSKG